MRKKIQIWDYYNNAEEFALQTFLKAVDNPDNIKKITHFRKVWHMPGIGFRSIELINSWRNNLSLKRNNPTLTASEIDSVKFLALYGHSYKSWYSERNSLVVYWKNFDQLRIDLKLPPRWSYTLQDYLLNNEVSFLDIQTGIDLKVNENQFGKPDTIIAELDFNTTYEDYLAMWPEIQKMQESLPQKVVKKRKPMHYLARNRLAWQLYSVEKLPMDEVINQMVAEEYPEPSPEDIYTWVKSYKNFIKN